MKRLILIGLIAISSCGPVEQAEKEDLPKEKTYNFTKVSNSGYITFVEHNGLCFAVAVNNYQGGIFSMVYIPREDMNFKKCE